MPKPTVKKQQITIENVESALTALELRHWRHQTLMESQRLARVTARERHYRPWTRRKLAPIHYAY